MEVGPVSVRACLYRGLDEARWRVVGSDVLNVRRLLEESQWWSRKRIVDYQGESLRQLVEHAYNHVPYYREVMKARGLVPSDIRGTQDLVKLPVLDKQTLRERWGQLVSDEADPGKVPVRRTGGTAGEPVKVARDPRTGAFEKGAYRRGLGFGGYRPGETIVKLFGGTLGSAPESLLDRLKARLLGVVFLPAFEISRQNVAEYVEVTQRSGAEFLRGYATALYLMSKWMMEAGLQLRLHAVFPTAEMLYDPQRALIADRLGEVFEYYGCGEVNSIAFECESHQGMHIADEHVLVEVLRDGERVPEGEMGAITLTTLQNRTMPLIRYQNGDVGVQSSQPCSCGRGLSRLVKLFGRANDLLLAKDGRLVSGAFMPSLFVKVGLQGVKQVQLIQEEKDVIHLKVVKDADYSEASLRPLLDAIVRYLGDVKIEIEYAGSIPTALTGKLQYVISKVGGNL
jgi:phenylacetate-CoA ligase